MYKCSCGKEYTRLKPFHYHRATCELLALSKETKQDVSHLTKMDVPAPLEMWMALQSALLKIEKLEKKIESQDRWIKRQKQKMSIIDWLNKNYFIEQSYDMWLDSITLNRRDLQLIFDHDFVGGVSYIIQRYLPVKNQEKFPLRAFEQKLNTLFVFNGKTWEMMDTDMFGKIIREFFIFQDFIEFTFVKPDSFTFWTDINNKIWSKSIYFLFFKRNPTPMTFIGPFRRCFFQNHTKKGYDILPILFTVLL